MYGQVNFVAPTDATSVGTVTTKAALDRWFPSIYDCLRDLAERRFRGESPGHTLQPTALVHDAYVRLAEGTTTEWRDRAHFLAVASTVLREVLVDHGRRRTAAKRGGGWCRISLDEADDGTADQTVNIVALDETLTELAKHHPRAARVVELRFFGGLSVEETARVLELSAGTVKLDWRFARAWLNHKLDRDPP